MKNKIMIIIIFVLMFCTSCNKETITKVTDYIEFNDIIKEASVLKYDIRTTLKCEEGHIPNFMCMGDDRENNKELSIETANTIMQLYDKNKKIVIIGLNSDVLETLSILKDNGYKHLYYFDGGYDAYYEQAKDTFTPEEGCGC